MNNIYYNKVIHMILKIIEFSKFEYDLWSNFNSTLALLKLMLTVDAVTYINILTIVIDSFYGRSLPIGRLYN